MIKDCFNKNNSRNRDILTQQKAMGKHIYLDDIQDVGNANSIDALEDRMDMQFLNIIDNEGNLIVNDVDVLQSSDDSSYNGRKSSKKRK